MQMKLHHLLHEYFMQSQLQSLRLAEPGAGAGPCCPCPVQAVTGPAGCGAVPSPRLAARSRSCWASRGCCCRVPVPGSAGGRAVRDPRPRAGTSPAARQLPSRRVRGQKVPGQPRQMVFSHTSRLPCAVTRARGLLPAPRGGPARDPGQMLWPPRLPGNEDVKRGGCRLRPPRLLTFHRAAQGPPPCPPALCGTVVAPPWGGSASCCRLPPAPRRAALVPAGAGGVPAASTPTPAPAQPGALAGAGSGTVLLGMDGAAFWVMKYSQVSDSVRNDGDQSIPFQGVIFFPFTASVSC